MKIKKLLAIGLSASLLITSLSLGNFFAASTTSENVFYDDFESGVMGWIGRGDATVEVVNTTANSGSQSLFVSGRQKIWNGASADKNAVLKIGETYTFGAAVMYNGDSYAGSQKFELCMQYTLNGTTNYPAIASATAYKGAWTKMEGRFTVPDGATGVSIYVQTAYTSNPTSNDLMNFYIDDIYATSLVQSIQTDIASLKDVYSSYFKVGCATTASELASSTTKALIKKHYNSITPGNELKPDAILDQNATLALMNQTGDDTNPQINLSPADSILKFAAENSIPVRGHVLVWHSQTPDWFFKEGFVDSGAWVDKETMIARMENYIKNVMQTLATEYPDVKFYAWDVVNETYTDSGTMRTAGSNNTTSGNSAWVQVFGDDSFIDYAFQFARKYAPEGCKLFYNDYNEYIQSKRDAIYNKALELKGQGLIDGIGMQSHLDVSFPSVSVYQQALEKFASTGLDVQITELDVTCSDSATQATYYGNLAKAIRDSRAKYSNITAVVLWGITDATSWRTSKSPLLFDADYQAKNAFYSFIANVEPLEYTEGDINMDGSVNISDLIVLKKYVLAQITDINIDLADVNADGKINSLDASALIKILLAQ